MKIAHVTIQTDKFDEEVRFYEEQTELKVQRDMRPARRNMVFLADAAGDTCIEIIENKDAADSGNPNFSIGFHTDDVAGKREALAAAGYDVTPMITPMPDVKFFFVKDPAGVTVQFI
jgi:lactoylglutathione lyase